MIYWLKEQYNNVETKIIELDKVFTSFGLTKPAWNWKAISYTFSINPENHLFKCFYFNVEKSIIFIYTHKTQL